MPFRYELIRNWEPFGRYRWGQKLLERLIPGFQPSALLFLNTIARLVSGDIRWLDAGCGTNWLIAHFAAGPNGIAVGADIVVAHPLHNHDRFVNADLRALPFADASFDLVSTESVVEHLKHPESFLAEVKRILKPGGILLIRGPNRRSPLVAASRRIPARLKRPLIKIFFHESADLFPTYYRLNTPFALALLPARFGLKLKTIVLTEDPMLSYLPVFLLSLVWVFILNQPAMKLFRSRMLAIFERSFSG